MLISTLMVQKPILTDTIPKHHSLLFFDYAAHLNFERRWFLIRDKRISGSKDLEGKNWYIVYTTLEREGNGLKLFGKRWPTLWLENLKKTAWIGLLKVQTTITAVSSQRTVRKIARRKKTNRCFVCDKDNSDVVRRLQGPTVYWYIKSIGSYGKFFPKY